jgi:hypothetical protein
MIAKPKSKPKKKKTQLRRKPGKLMQKRQSVKRKGVKKCQIVSKGVKSEFHPVPKPCTRNGIKQVSQRQAERERNLTKLKHFLKTKRAKGVCEICGSSYHLQGAHIIERAVGGRDNAGNVLICCEYDHRHDIYPHGLPISTTEALMLVADKNRDNGISKFLTGDQVPREEIETWVD